MIRIQAGQFVCGSFDSYDWLAVLLCFQMIVSLHNELAVGHDDDDDDDNDDDDHDADDDDDDDLILDARSHRFCQNLQ